MVDVWFGFWFGVLGLGVWVVGVCFRFVVLFGFVLCVVVCLFCF